MCFWVGLNKVRVRVSDMETAEKRERKRKKEKNEENRFRSLLCKVVNRVGSNPTHSPLRVAVGCWSCWIRINPTPQRRPGDPDPSMLGFGPFTRRPLVLFSVSWVFPVVCTSVFAIWTSCVSWLLYEIPKKFVMRSWYICDCFVIFYMWKLIETWQVLISHLIGVFCVFFINFLACLLIQIFVLWFWWISTWFHDDLPLFS